MPLNIYFHPPKIMTLRFKDQAISQRPVNARTYFENLIFEDITFSDVLSIWKNGRIEHDIPMDIIIL
jgi:hypothetical protein